MDYDVAIIGEVGLVHCSHECPAPRLDRKVGESTTEVSSCFMTRILGLANYLGHEQLAKQGLRMWFCNSPEQKFDDCVEIGPRYGSRVQTFQVDRAKLDSHLLECAVNAGCELMRPAKVTKIELDGANGQTVDVDLGNERRAIRARWLIDASGRATLLARRRREGLGQLRLARKIPRLHGRMPDRAFMGDESSDRTRLVGLDYSVARRRCERVDRFRQSILSSADQRQRC